MSEVVLPEATIPSKAAKLLREEYVSHAKTTSNFSGDVPSYEVTCWVDGGSESSLIAEISNLMDMNGYDMKGVTEVEDTGSVRVKFENRSE